MIQEHIYAKDITRPINGVIKADSKSELAEEITEYIITGEQMKLLPNLFDMLTPPSRQTCVWISGDFGSGKSHLLKILSYLLENKENVDGQTVAEIFADKAKDDFELQSAITRSCRIPTESVLFNIQKELDGVSKQTTIDPVLNIFLKVFNRKLGFDEKKPEIAEIERYFDNKGKLEYLHSEYEKRFGEKWVDARKSILLKLQKLAEIMADMEGIDKSIAYQNIKSQIDNYKLDIDGFVALVKEHLDKQAPGSRFIFFVDEVGQFIGKDVHRMLSLQTIAESLVDMTDGRASMMVTSQMDIDATLGNLEKQQEYDFSRIQGRFTTRIYLTSANADEVIQRRLLEKKPEYQTTLGKVYDRQKNIIRTLFNFGDSSQFKTQYKSEEQFAIDFPFIDYQFDLLQHSIIELSKNNAFTGKQQSVGERSMLTITQDVAKLYKDKGLDDIVQFSDMYEGLRGILQAKIQSDIQLAERTLCDDMALKVLKALFLVKYVKGFPSTTDNITKILLPSIDTDFIAYKEQVQEALNKLVRTSYIEKAANDEYHYQTNEEKDIENEIKNQQIDPDAINTELKKIFSDHIFFESKIKLSANKIFPYGKYVDDSQDGREADIYINFITPLSSQKTSHDDMTIYSMYHPNHLCVVLGEDKYLAEDLSMYKKAEKCLTRLLSSAGDYRQQIVTDKRRVNSRRRENIIERLTNLTKDARLYIFGNEITDIRYSDIKTRLTEGMKRLVEQVYIHLQMLSVEYDDPMLKQIINATSNGTLPLGEEMDACCQEVYNKIVKDKNLSIRNRVKDLVEYFRGNQYGWYETATLCILAKLYKLDKISFRINGNQVDDRNLYVALTNSQQQAQLIVDVEETITNSQVAKLKSLYKEIFAGENCTVQGAKEVHRFFSDRISQELGMVEQIRKTNKYEFAKPLDEVIREMRQYVGIVYPGLYLKMNELEGLIDTMEDVLEPIREFVKSAQLDIFDKVVTMKNRAANLSYVSQELVGILNETYNSPTPWKLITKAKAAIGQIETEIKQKQEDARKEVTDAIENKLSSIKSLPAYDTLKDNQRGQIAAIFDVLSKKAGEERYIGNLKAMHQEVDSAYDTCIEWVNKWVEEAAKAASAAASSSGASGTTSSGGTTTGAGASQTSTSTTSAKIKKSVTRQKAMNVTFNKPYLENDQDVEAYINALRRQLMDYINKDTNIMLN